MGQRSDFSKPCQRAAEKSANATRCCCLVRGSQCVGMSTGMTAVLWWRYRTRTARAERSEGNQSPSGLLLSPRFPTHRNVYQERCRQTHSSQVFLFWWTVQDENRDKQRQGITMRAISCLLIFLTRRGILGSVRQLGI